MTNFFMLFIEKNQDSKRIGGLILGLTFKCLNLEYLCSVSPLYKYARLYADYAKILQHPRYSNYYYTTGAGHYYSTIVPLVGSRTNLKIMPDRVNKKNFFAFYSFNSPNVMWPFFSSTNVDWQGGF